MKAFTRVFVGFSALALGQAFGVEAKLRVQGSQELRLAIVDSSRQTSGREALHEAFAEGLAKAINDGGGAPIEVKTKRVNPDHAAFNLGTGVYDAVLVIANQLPRPLILSETKRLVATLSTGREEKKAFLIFQQADEGLEKVLTAAFTPAITNSRFLDALDGGFEKVDGANGGSKIAAR